MTLNPIQFGSQVVDQYGRYLASNFPLADSSLYDQFKEQVKHALGGERFLVKGPYVFLNRPFEQGPSIDQLLSEKELGLHQGLKSVFTFQYLHKHQENAIRSIKKDKNIIITTGTGSGKTEGFLLPIIDYCLKLRDGAKSTEENSGVVAVLVYPMNALVNDQLKRFRRILAGTKITFGRFTSETPETKNESTKQLESPRQYTKEELNLLDTDPGNVPHPWEECISEEDIRKRKPRLLLTNYKQLEYLLSRYNDYQIFKNAPIKFIVFDEVHTYSGALGSEVACLTRRLKNLVSTDPSQIICIGTSATITSESNNIMNKAIKNFAGRFFGCHEDKLDIIEESFRPSLLLDDDLYEPPAPPAPQKLLEKILEKSLEYQLQEEVTDISTELLQLAEELCGNKFSGSNNMNKLYNLLVRNRLLKDLDSFFQKPKIFNEILHVLRSHQGRKNYSDDDLAAEVLAYLTLGALARFDEEPLLRPKIHYFVRGLQGLWCIIENGKLLLLTDERKVDEQTRFKFPLSICQSCGQHYFRIFGDSEELSFDKKGKNVGIRKVRSPVDWHDSPHEGEIVLYLTNELVSQEESQIGKYQIKYMCSFCGTLHSEKLSNCQNDLCGRTIELLNVLVWMDRPNTCAACGATGRAYPTIRESVSNTVGDIMILAQDMLTSMTEKKFQKLLIFADNRQEAAHQAGWMKKRAERFRIRYFLYRLLDEQPNRIWNFDSLVENVLESAYNEQVLKRKAFDRYKSDDEIYIKWTILEEFGTQQRKKGNIENLGLCEVKYDGLDKIDNQFLSKWAKVFDYDQKEIQNIIRVVLDYCRRHNTLSDPLFLRLWNYQDLEFRKGLIGVTDYHKPMLLLLNTSLDKNTKTYTMAWIGQGLRSGVQQIVKKSIRNELIPKPEDLSNQINNFLRDLWTVLLKQSIIVEKTLKSKRYGKIQEYRLAEPGYKINIDKIGMCISNERYLCKSCKTSSAVPLPTMKCSQYNCNGTMEKAGRDNENYDVVRYTKLKPVPLKPYEHTAQIAKNDREKIETEFKKEDGQYNCLVASPTLELGVDIGALEMVLMRNAPPTPANYSQRAGRAGRRHRIAVVFTYTGMSNHDRYFFDKPPKLITGDIRIPSFSMQNEVIIRKHIHSIVHTMLLELCNESEREILSNVFPTFIWPYFLIKNINEDGSVSSLYLKEAPRFDDLQKLIDNYFPQIMAKVFEIFLKEWPHDDSKVITQEKLIDFVKNMSKQLEEYVQRLFFQIKTYRNLLKKYAQKTLDDEHITLEDKKEYSKYQNALETFSREDQFTYTLTYLSNDGFFPGYGLARDQSIAKCLEPYQEIIRAPPVALREMTPAARIYANMNIFEVTKIDFYKFKKEDVVENPLFYTIGYDVSTKQIFDPSGRKIEGPEDNFVKLESVHLLDAELERILGIDDRRDFRFKTSFEIQGMLLNTHSGGREGKIGEINFRYLTRESIRLVNLGPKELVFQRNFGFPVCHKCGETRNPFASGKELEHFTTEHQKRCGIAKINNLTFHIDFVSDVLCLGPYLNYPDALNLKEAILNRSRAILDMGDMELEGFVYHDNKNMFWAVLYDPTPGGSGLLPQILIYWEHIVENGIKFLSGCVCKQACYSCMKNYSNQPHHEILDRHRSIQLLAKIDTKVQESFEIPMVVVKKGHDEDYKTDSDAEQEFLSILEMHGFPSPILQYKVNLNGEYTVADFAYVDDLPRKTILIFIDGLSKKIHGNPESERKDKIKRAKLELEEYKVLTISARGLKDKTELRGFLEVLALYLDRLKS